MRRIDHPEGLFAYRYDPYSLKLLPGNSYHDKVGAAIVFHEKKETSGSPCRGGDRSCSTTTSGGFSDTSSCSDVLSVTERSPSRRTKTTITASPHSSTALPVGKSVPPLKPSVVHYALVQLKFFSGYFIAPFRVISGDAVVVEDHAGALFLGIVVSVTTDPNLPYMEGQRVVRHAREADRIAKRDLEVSDLDVLRHFQLAVSVAVAEGRMMATVAHVEWAIDLTCVQVLCHVASDTDGDELVDVLATSGAVPSAVAIRVHSQRVVD